MLDKLQENVLYLEVRKISGEVRFNYNKMQLKVEETEL